MRIMMKPSSRMLVLSVLAFVFASAAIAWGQGTNPPPTTPPANPAPANPPANPPAPVTPPATPAAAPTAPTTAENPSVMLLKQGHTENIRAKAADDLGKQGDRSTIPALADALKDPSPKVRHEAVLALAQFHQSDVLPPLEQATRDADDGVAM